MGKFFKKIASGVKDFVNLNVQPFVTVYNSVTGDDKKLEYTTKPGAWVANVSTTVNTTINSAAKAFADTITGGYATKAVNLIRKDENKETAFHYNESRGALGQAGTAIGGALAKAWGGVGGGVGSGGASYPIEDVTKVVGGVVRKYWWVGALLFIWWLVFGD